MIKTQKGAFEIHKASWGWGVLNLANGHVHQCKSEEECWQHLRSHSQPSADLGPPAETWGHAIHVYTRRQAIEDGTLIDLMLPETVSAVREAGFKVPVAVTGEVFAECVALTPAAEEAGNDLQGRLWDLLWVLRQEIRRANSTSQVDFQIRCVVDSIQPSTVELTAVYGPDDDGKPCINIMYPWEA